MPDPIPPPAAASPPLSGGWAQQLTCRKRCPTLSWKPHVTNADASPPAEHFVLN